MKLTLERVLGGWLMYKGPLKLAVITTTHHQGLFRDGAPLQEPMKHASWSIHFTSPSMPVELLEEIVKSLPTEA